MTPLTRNLFVFLIALGLLIGACTSLMSLSNQNNVQTDVAARATAVATQDVQRQVQNALAANIAQRAVEMHADNPRIALLLALEALAWHESGANSYPTQHAIWQVLTEGTAVELAGQVEIPSASLECVSRNGRWQVHINDVGDVILHDRSAGETPVAHDLLWGGTHAAKAVWFSPDNHWLAVAREQENVVYVWDLQDENWSGPLKLGEGKMEATAVALSADGRWLAVGGADHKVRLWLLAASDPAESLQVLRRVAHDDGRVSRDGHTGAITGLAFSPDGRWLASGGKDDTVRLWDLEAADIGHWPIVLPQPRDDVRHLFFTTDGIQLYATDGAMTYVWNVDRQSLVAKACRITGGHFQEAEWHDYMPTLDYRHTCDAFR